MGRAMNRRRNPTASSANSGGIADVSGDNFYIQIGNFTARLSAAHQYAYLFVARKQQPHDIVPEQPRSSGD
jgi:hypothetical protein